MQTINGNENNITESFQNNYIIKLSNIDKSNSINFYILFINQINKYF